MNLQEHIRRVLREDKKNKFIMDTVEKHGVRKTAKMMGVSITYLYKMSDLEIDEFVAKEPTPEPVSLKQAAQLVQQAFGESEPIPTCSHGTRNIKNGVSAAGKAWQGAMCEVRGASKGDRCAPIWYVMSKTTGQWRLPEGVE